MQFLQFLPKFLSQAFQDSQQVHNNIGNDKRIYKPANVVPHLGILKEVNIHENNVGYTKDCWLIVYLETILSQICKWLADNYV